MSQGRSGPPPEALRVLYISYDGLLDPLGRSQILPYIERLAGAGIEFDVATFEKAARAARETNQEAVRLRLVEKGIRWIPLRYHKRPRGPATLYDMLSGVLVASAIAGRRMPHIIHARSYIPAFMASIVRRVRGSAFVFDMRGFWVDERREIGGLGRSQLIYRALKRLEARCLAEADHVVTLTARAKAELERTGATTAPVTVIPTCVDLDAFRPPAGGDGRRPAAPVLVYAGSIGSSYPLGEMLAFYRHLWQRFPGARFVVLTQGDETLIRHEIAQRDVPWELVTWRSTEYCDVPAWLEKADIGLAFYRPGYSRIGTCPTKVGEYLACGLPVVASRGVGDLEAVLAGHRVGVVIPAFTEQGYEQALRDLCTLLEDPHLARRCREVAAERFSLAKGAEKYLDIYRQVAGSPVHGRHTLTP